MEAMLLDPPGYGDECRHEHRGELAGEPVYLAQIRKLGIDTVSVSSRLITSIRAEVNKTNKEESNK